MAKPTSCEQCGSKRLERFNATAPDGVVLEVLRCINCAAEVLTPAGGPASTGLLPRMVPGHSKEPVGPEDAMGPGPKRGDYSANLGNTGPTFESVPVVDPAPGAPRSRLVDQAARANDIGDEPGKKGGVTTGANKGARS